MMTYIKHIIDKRVPDPRSMFIICTDKQNNPKQKTFLLSNKFKYLTLF